MPWFTKKRKKKASFGFSGHIQGRFRLFPACFGRRPIRPDFGRISLVQRESKPIRHESSRVSANRAESARIREKKKKKNPRRGPTREQPRRVASDASAAPLVPCPCFLDPSTRWHWKGNKEEIIHTFKLSC